MQTVLSYRCGLETGGGQDALGLPQARPVEALDPTAHPQAGVLPFPPLPLQALALQGSQESHHTAHGLDHLSEGSEAQRGRGAEWKSRLTHHLPLWP